jgi:methionine-gamma-lyase
MTDRHLDLSPESLVLHADRELNETTAITPPIWQTSTFGASSAEEFLARATEHRGDRFYTRYGNPTHSQTAAVVASLEGAEAALMAGSGMAAISSTVLTFVGAGDHVVAQRNHYAGTASLLHTLLPRMGGRVTFVDQTDAGAFEEAIRPETKLIVAETPTNPLLGITDLRAIAEAARRRGVLTLVDNTFATPINQRPIELGVDLVVHSATKYLGGHSDLVAGVVAGPAPLLDRIWDTSLVLGGALSPFDSWLLLRGLRTLPVRIERHNQTALAVARFLEGHPAVERVNYPGLESHPQHALARSQMSGFGGMLSFELEGGHAAAERCIAAMRLASRAGSLGGVESLIVHPTAMWAHSMSEERLQEAGIRPGLVRFSVGLEGERDLIADLEQALTDRAG